MGDRKRLHSAAFSETSSDTCLPPSSAGSSCSRNSRTRRAEQLPAQLFSAAATAAPDTEIRYPVNNPPVQDTSFQHGAESTNSSHTLVGDRLPLTTAECLSAHYLYGSDASESDTGSQVSDIESPSSGTESGDWNYGSDCAMPLKKEALVQLENSLRFNHIECLPKGGRKLRPHALDSLLHEILKPRGGEATPKSKAIAKFARTLAECAEIDGVVGIMDLLFYKPFNCASIEDDKEECCWRTLNNQWSDQGLPVLDSEDPNAKLDTASLKLSPPKADVVFSYAKHVFTDSEKAAIDRLPKNTRVREGDPYCPYQPSEWKEDSGSPHECEMQAMKAGASAVSAMHNFLKATYQAASPEHTCVFPMVILTTRIKLFVSWRHVGFSPKTQRANQVSYQMDHLLSADMDDEDDVFRLRSAILNILAWAKGTRLQMIKSALGTRLEDQCPKFPVFSSGGLSDPAATAAFNTKAVAKSNIHPNPVVPPSASKPLSSPAPDPSEPSSSPRPVPFTGGISAGSLNPRDKKRTRYD